MSDLVSIIIPVYKVQQYLPRCIESVLNQTYKNFELILVDDGSPDNSGAICDEYAKKDSRIKVIHKQNGGVSSARNAGIKIAQGEFINFVDSDDWIPNDSLENLINLQKENNVDFVCGTVKIYNANNPTRRIPFISKYIDFTQMTSTDAEIFLFNVYRSPYLKLFKNSILKKYGVLFDVSVPIGEDSIFVYGYLSKCKTMQTGDCVVYNYIKNDQSATSKAYKDFYMYMIKDNYTQIEFFNSLHVNDMVKKCYSVYRVIFSFEYASSHYLRNYTYQKAVEGVKAIYNRFVYFFNSQEQEVYDFLKKFSTDRKLNVLYKILTSKNGVEKYCKYKLRQKRINDLKISLKKIKIINDLNNFIKGRNN